MKTICPGGGPKRCGSADRVRADRPLGRGPRRELAATGVRVWETRTLAGCREELEQSPASFVALEVAGDLSGLLRFMVQQSRDFSAARLAAVADVDKGVRGQGSEGSPQRRR